MNDERQETRKEIEPYVSEKVSCLQELQEIAWSRDGGLISPALMGMQKKHHWRCARGHEWKTKPSHVKSVGSWRPVCSGHLLINPLQQLQEIAEQRGGSAFLKLDRQFNAPSAQEPPRGSLSTKSHR